MPLPLTLLSLIINCPIHKAFVASITKEIEPNTYAQVVKTPSWCKAMQAEIKALEMNDTWTVVDLPQGKEAIGENWCTKSSTMQMEVLRDIRYRWNLHQLDVHNAFLHGDSDEKASRQWYAKLSDFIVQKGFKQSKADYSLFTRLVGEFFTATLVYVDDLIIAGNDMETAHSLKSSLHDRFKIKDLGTLKYFLGLEVARSKRGIYICQKKYALEILSNSGTIGAATVKIPLDQNSKLPKDQGALLKNPSIYRRLIERLLYLAITKPDLTYSVQLLSKFMQAPRVPHLNATHKVLRYIKRAPDQGLLYSSQSNLQLEVYCDSDWGASPDTRKSIRGYCAFHGPSLVSWKSIKQNTISRSSTEAKYRAMASACCELTWLRFLLQDLMVDHHQVAVS
ncbi:uncharacterized mitochondrial protein AtMg00810-like [Carya illinoinensis]|uniref:uncharacterized mitochondrial protein AtMg00810-like n=1 Tax=Carya illinoinensis TaxID=32201 RepID=UPI001C727B47|nr:uncharacterized mitochondrial protein AtMg00810-like [Carya illinoinensis]